MQLPPSPPQPDTINLSYLQLHELLAEAAQPYAKLRNRGSFPISAGAHSVVSMRVVADPLFQNLRQARTVAVVLICFSVGNLALADSSPAAGEKALKPLWRQAAEKIARDSKFWATGVNSVQTVYDDAGQLLGSVETQDELELAEGRPVWKQKSKVKKGDPGFVLSMDLGIQERPGVILKEYDAWTLLRKEVFAGVPVEVWKGVETAESANTATAYLSAETALSLRIIFPVPFSNLLTGRKTFSLTVEYKEAPAGAWLLSRTLIDQTALLFLIKRRVHIESEYRDWRPVASASAPRPPST